MCLKYIDKSEFRGDGGDAHGPLYIFCLLLKKWKKYKSMTFKSNSTSFWFKDFFLRINNKNFTKRGPQGAPLLFGYKVSIVVLIDFIAILLTPGIFLIQIVNTNNTNMYLIHFYTKNNIQMSFLKSWVFKVSNQSQSFIIHQYVVK